MIRFVACGIAVDEGEIERWTLLWTRERTGDPYCNEETTIEIDVQRQRRVEKTQYDDVAVACIEHVLVLAC